MTVWVAKFLRRMSHIGSSRQAVSRTLKLAVLAAALSVPILDAQAQSIDCNRLQRQIAAAGRGDGGNAARYSNAAAKQSSELNRTVAYARSIGCNRQQFLFFGEAPPPQCGAINARIGQMQANLGQLQAQASGGGSSAQRQDLIARYNAYCRGAEPTVAQPRERNLFEALFGSHRPEPEMQQIPLEDPEDKEKNDDPAPRGGSQAVCVRTCDGGFFPVSYSARRSNMDTLEDLCKALCPNTEVKLFTRNGAKDIDTALSSDGDAYTTLANALKFQKSFDPTCTCKPPNQSWVQALAEAEKILGKENKRDIIVTPEKAEELSRAKPVKIKLSRAEQRAEADRKAAEAASAAELAIGQNVPTASKDVTGISAGNARTGMIYGEGQGEFREVVGADGVKRKIRIVGPLL